VWLEFCDKNRDENNWPMSNCLFIAMSIFLGFFDEDTCSLTQDNEKSTWFLKMKDMPREIENSRLMTRCPYSGGK